MKKNYILGMIAVASLGLTACSQDEDPIDQMDSNQEEQVKSEYKMLSKYQFDVKEGDIMQSGADSRTIVDIDKNYRPTGEYKLDYVYLLGLEPKDQPTKPVSITWKSGYASAKAEKQNVAGEYSLYYRLGDDIKNVPGYSKQGTIYLTQKKGDKSHEIAARLSIFDAEDLKNSETKKIPLNQFGFDSGIADLKGTMLRYASYDPTSKIGPGLAAGKYIELPAVPSGAKETKRIMQSGVSALKDNLVTQCKDEWFNGADFLVALVDEKDAATGATHEFLYLLKEDPSQNEAGGYYFVRKYPETAVGENVGKAEVLSLDRLTSNVNASFILVDEEYPEENPYFKGAKTIEEASAKFQTLYHTDMDLTTMECPYAALDGVSTRFYINRDDEDAIDTKHLGRLALWSTEYKVKAADGIEYSQVAERSMEIAYHFGAQDNSSRTGFGMEGKSFSVIFQGAQNSTKNQNVYFWTSVNDVKIQIVAPIGNAGISFDKNTAHHIVVFVPVRKFVEAYETIKSKANAGEYATLELSSDCVAIE